MTEMNSIMGLTLTQPHATLVVTGPKKNETRSWNTRYRGLLAIHAGRKFPQDCRDLYSQEPFAEALGGQTVTDAFKTLGCIIGVARLEYIFSTTDSPWRIPDPGSWEWRFGDYSPGRYAWVLSEPHLLEKPIPCRGRLGLWTLPPEVLQSVLNQLPERTA